LHRQPVSESRASLAAFLLCSFNGNDYVVLFSENKYDDDDDDHRSMAPLISSWLIMPRQLFRTCFRCSSVRHLFPICQLLKNAPNWIIHIV